MKVFQVTDANGNLLATYPLLPFAQNHFGTWGLEYRGNKNGGSIWIRGKMKGLVVVVPLRVPIKG